VYFLAKLMMIASFVPSMMMSLMIALGIDYSLFLLSRFREELLAGEHPQRAVANMLATSGHTIVVSGVTLIGCFAGKQMKKLRFYFEISFKSFACIVLRV
jgi:uncharacterized membrane protein YdfJ with MMPL/SSD domain